jgi:transposase
MSAAKMTRARALRAKGLTYAEIGTKLGVSTNTAYRWLNPGKAERDRQRARAWKARNREHLHSYDAAYAAANARTCGTCGGPMHYKTIGTACATCTQARRHERALAIERMWRDGLTVYEIADRVGWTKDRLGIEMANLRADGYDLPHRRTPEQVDRIRAGWARVRAEREASAA